MIGSMLSGRYRLESKLGSGGMSTVYLAVDETLGRHVAIKVLHGEISDQADQLERFRREARAVAQLSHPNLVGVIDAGEEGGRPFIVFEYVPGQTLKQRISSEGRLPLDEAVAYAIEIGRGLQAAHAARLVHRDVKPQNVLIDPEGRAKITDFGIALSLESHGLTATGRVLGTTDYVSPEQAMGKEIDPRTDVYSLGILLYEMLTGEVPFKAETQVGVAMKHVNETVPNVQRRRPDASAVLAAAVERATAKEPRDRYRDMGEFLTDLEHALEVEVSRAGGATGEATSVLESVPDKRRRILTRRRISWAGVLLLVAAAAAAIAIAALSGEEGPSKEPPPDSTTSDVIAIQSATDFDPAGDGEEHEEETGLAFDGSPSTAWTTEDYTAGLEGAAKDGVGLYVDAGSSVTPSQLALRTGGGAWTFEVYGSDLKTAPTEIDGWGSPLTSELTAEPKMVVDLDTSSPNRFFLIWSTSVEDGTPAEINDIRLLS
ncbi:MAG: serine/threonine protein kinase [Solirubrobacterales bacterium]|nr:serine/threonine protein kinase [Solirubrobacterales bacterium]